MSYFQWGSKSRKRQKGIRPELIQVLDLALSYQILDMTMIDDNSGVRTIEMQRALVEKGASKTMNSRHLIQEDGYGHAFDVGPYPIDWNDLHPGKLDGFEKVAHCIRAAAIELNVHLTWGAVWDRPLHELSGNLDLEVANYVKRRKAMGKRAFLDYPHFQFEGFIV